MRFTNFYKISINENENLDTRQTIEFFNTHIKQDCKEYLKIMKRSRNMLYRGINNIHYDFGTLSTHDTRIPVSLNLATTNVIDEYFMKHTGIHFRTSNALFTTANMRMASGYGTPYCVFPIGIVNYVFFEHVYDLFFTLYDQNVSHRLSELLWKVDNDQPYDHEQFKNAMFDLLNEHKLYFNKGILNAVLQRPFPEVIFNTKQYHVIRADIWTQIAPEVW